MPESLILRKINYAEEKKLEIANQVGITTGNPTWDNIKSAITTTINGYTTADKEHLEAVSEYVNIKWNGLIGGSAPTTNQGQFVDNICYEGLSTFLIGKDDYYEYVEGWSRKHWNNLAPNKSKGALGTWNDKNGVLHYADSSVYNPTTDNWEAAIGITLNGFNIANAYPRCFWKDYEGNVHYDYGANHYVYDDDTNTWTSVTWNVETNIIGDFIWTDGTTIYYSNSYGDTQYYLDSETNEWTAKTWDSSSAISSFDGQKVFYMPIQRAYSSGMEMNRATEPFLENSGNYYKFDTTLGYWTPYKFMNLTISSIRSWYWKEANMVCLYTSNTRDTLKAWYPIQNNWTAILNSLNETIDYLMKN